MSNQHGTKLKADKLGNYDFVSIEDDRKIDGIAWSGINDVGIEFHQKIDGERQIIYVVMGKVTIGILHLHEAD